MLKLKNIVITFYKYYCGHISYLVSVTIILTVLDYRPTWSLSVAMILTVLDYPLTWSLSVAMILTVLDYPLTWSL